MTAHLTAISSALTAWAKLFQTLDQERATARQHAFDQTHLWNLRKARLAKLRDAARQNSAAPPSDDRYHKWFEVIGQFNKELFDGQRDGDVKIRLAYFDEESVRACMSCMGKVAAEVHYGEYIYASGVFVSSPRAVLMPL